MANKKKLAGPGPGKLRRVWDKKQKMLGLTQSGAADILGFSSQAAVSQYLNGDIPLGIEAAMKFAELLQEPIAEIWEGAMPSALFDLSTEEIKDLVRSRLSPSDQLALASELVQSAAANSSTNSAK